MAKNRMIRPEVWTDDKFVSLTPLARLLFIGMWNFACDNGHLDDSVLQLKMRVLPADNCDAANLLNELLEAGMVARQGGYLKVVNLSAKQPLDLRFLVFCDHCDEDDSCRYSREDKKGSPGPHAGRTRAARESPSSARRSGDGDGDGDGEALTRPDVDDVCTLLADLIEGNGSKRPNVTKRWRDSARLMLDADGRSLAEVKSVMRWSQADDFWRSNVLSMPKFREKYDTLRMQSGRGAKTKASGSDDNYWSNW